MHNYVRALRANFGGAMTTCALVLCACTPAMHEYRQRPTPLARDWLDGKKTTAADTSVWRLDPGGTDYTLHVLVDSTRAGTGAQTLLSKHGIWYLHGALGDTASRRLCFIARLGRALSSTCDRFTLDTLGDGRLQLHILQYTGTHETAPRTLVERRP